MRLGRHLPSFLLLDPSHLCHRRLELNVPTDVVLVRAIVEIGSDLWLTTEKVRPVGIGLERERVEVRRHIARAARIRVRVPSPANVCVPFDENVVVHAELIQLDRHAQTREASTDDKNVVFIIALVMCPFQFALVLRSPASKRVISKPVQRMTDETEYQ